MSLIVRNISSIREEWRQLMKKKIKKTKRKNQYTIPYKFDDDIQKSQQKDDSLLIVQNIPTTIPNYNVFRLKTNIQFSLNINKDHSLGSLFMDPHSNNYKIVRIDKRKNLFILTLDQIDRPITPTEVLYSIFRDRNSELAQAFMQYNSRNLDPKNFKLRTMQEMLEFEYQIKGKPYAVYVNIYKDGIWKTFQKIYSQEILQVQGISEDMLYHYCNETNLIPISAYFDENDEQLNVCYKIFKGIVGQQSIKREYMNYNGEQFTASLTVQSFFIYDEEKDVLFDYTYFVTDCDKKWLSQERVKKNELDYFNIKPNSCSTEESSYQEPLRRCGFKILNQK
ncbi:unnamed protein product (macronuclear) [Paramecium tetraurelia]|uniref:Uncharacterized protein n=1 Tax=Paramecium tetraurelia TaxID=5888 RepID=A0EHJ7_PARTE|nr:uncharacterized protein GSPATT00027112001 [Paramecium tetraurelia]CAK94788.1 unnamed protein product [Paramecium tetraurelia]|eukprot:XP_001462161.1 hypothetical protein (macronuclear) [Paramecium tetraurelia strain d4-2]